MTAYQLLEVSGGRRLAVRALPRSAYGRAALRTRCGGPLAADLGPLPAAPVDLAVLRGGGRTLDLRARREFAGGGYAGVVRSTVRIRLGGPYDDGDQRAIGVGDDPLPGVLTARYRVRSLEGRVDVDLRGAGPPVVCGPLDSCGAAGTLTVRPSARAGAVAFVARARGGADPAALRAAFGAGPGPAARDLRVFGAGLLRGPTRVDAVVDREDGSRCAAAGRAGRGSVAFRTRDGRLHAVYRPVALQSRCPGPLLQRELATGSVPLRALRHSTVTIPLSGGRTHADDGWRATTRPDLLLRLERRAVRVEPAG